MTLTLWSQNLISTPMNPNTSATKIGWNSLYWFYRATACNATHGIAVGILSVRLSVRCVYCDKTKWCTADILIPHETAITLVLWHQHWSVGDAPFLWNLRSEWPTPFEKRRLRPISAHNVSSVGDREKSSITTNIKLTTGFPTSYRWSAYITPKSWRVAQKMILKKFFPNKSQLQ